MCVLCDIKNDFGKILHSPSKCIIVFPPYVFGKTTKKDKITLTLLSESGTHETIYSPIIRGHISDFLKEKHITFIDYRQN